MLAFIVCRTARDRARRAPRALALPLALPVAAPRPLAQRALAVLLAGLATLAVLGAAAASAAGQQIDSVQPAQGTLGTVVVVDGSGFGSKRPQVFLEFPGAQPGSAPKKAALKLIAFTDSQVMAQIVKAQAGPCSLHVKLRTGGEASTGFEIMAPQVTSVSPASAVPGGTVVLSGQYFGSKPVKVLLWDRRARVVAASDSSLTIEIPAKLPDGTFVPHVETAIGADWAPSAVTVSGSLAAWGPDKVKARVDGAHYLVKDAGAISGAFLPGSKFAFDSYQIKDDGTQQLSLIVPFNKSTTPLPASYSGSGFGSQPLYFQLLGSPGNAGVPTVWAAKPGLQPWSVMIVAKGGNHVAGILSATLVRVSGPGPDVLHIEDGRFLVTP
jgi:hypothetical protein